MHEAQEEPRRVVEEHWQLEEREVLKKSEVKGPTLKETYLCLRSRPYRIF